MSPRSANDEIVVISVFVLGFIWRKGAVALVVEISGSCSCHVKDVDRKG